MVLSFSSTKWIWLALISWTKFAWNLASAASKKSAIGNKVIFSISLAFLGSGPKGPMSCRTQGGISIRPSVLPSVPPPRWPQIRSPSPQICPPSPQFSPPGLKSAFQASNQPPHLKSVLQTSNLPSRPSISPPSIKSALHGLNLPSKTQIGSPSLDSALQPSNMPSAV